MLDEPLEDLKLITLHLGNGCSASAIDHGVAVDTSDGPQRRSDGLMMGTRCGAIDPAVVRFVMEHENLTAEEMNNLMNKQSGLLGISGVSNDLRSVRTASEEGNERAMLAYDSVLQLGEEVHRPVHRRHGRRGRHRADRRRGRELRRRCAA